MLYAYAASCQNIYVRTPKQNSGMNVGMSTVSELRSEGANHSWNSSYSDHVLNTFQPGMAARGNSVCTSTAESICAFPLCVSVKSEKSAPRLNVAESHSQSGPAKPANGSL